MAHNYDRLVTGLDVYMYYEVNGVKAKDDMETHSL